ncbi:MAG: ABC transporter substrate-binding protein [Lachnospirales bacterium]
MKYNVKALLAPIIALVVVFSGCNDKEKKSGNDSNTNVESENKSNLYDGDLTYKGDITVYAQAYQPVEPTEENPNPPTALKSIAKKYEELHPEINIDFLTTVTGDDYITWLKTKMSAGEAPDVVWAQGTDLKGGTYPKGSMIDLAPIFEEYPNTYIGGNEKWIDTFTPSIYEQLPDENGSVWQLNADYVATAVVYNKEMFAKADITNLPTTWEEFNVVCDKLMATGIIPYSYSMSNKYESSDRMSWLARLFYSNYYADEFQEMAVQGSEISLTPIEIAVAFKNGLYDVKDPKYLGWWEYMKEKETQYMPSDFISATNDNLFTFNMFVNKNIAMYFDGSWAKRDLPAANLDFEYGMFSFPHPTSNDDKYATDFNSTNAIGGPSGAFQFSIVSNRGNKTLTDDKLEACIDWLMYISTPENNSTIVNDLGSFIPTIVGATAGPDSKAIIDSLDNKQQTLDGGVCVTVAYLDAYYRIYQQYLSGAITIKEAREQLAPEAEIMVNEVIDNYQGDISQFLK